MSKVVIAAQISGTRNGKDWPVIGTEVDLPEHEAADMVTAGTAYWPGDERVAGLPGYRPLTDQELAGAPEARDITEGQPETNLVRAAVLAQEDNPRDVVREAAKATNLDDEHTAPDQVTDAPVVGDGTPDPLGGDVESAAVANDAETAAVAAKPKPRPSK